MHFDSALALALLCALLGLLVPTTIGLIPEPEPESDPAPPLPPLPAKSPADLLAPTASVGPEADVPDAPGASGTAADEEPAKEPYLDISRLPGLRTKATLASAVCGGLIGLGVGWSWSLMFLALLVPVGVALAVVDWRTRLLPTRLIAPSYVVLLILVLACFAITQDTDDLIRAVWGWLIAGGLFFLLWFIHPKGLGYGDVRLSGLLGIALGQLGWGVLLVGVYAGFLLGGLGGGLLSLLHVVERRHFPFGPFMLIGALVGILFGHDIGHLVVGRS